MSDEYLKHVDPPQNEEGWIEYALQKLWSETDGYEGLADNAAAELSALRERVAELEAEKKIVITFLQEVADDVHCDNDGRGCGASTKAGELAAALKEKKG